MTTAIMLRACCPFCGLGRPGMASRRFPGLVKIDPHLHPRNELGPCAGSGCSVPSCTAHRGGFASVAAAARDAVAGLISGSVS